MSSQSHLVSTSHAMKWFVTLGVLAAISVGCDEVRQEKRFSLRIEDGPTPERVFVHCENGSVRLAGSATDTVAVEATVTVRIAESQAEAAFKSLEPTVQRRSDQPATVEVVFKVPNELRRNNAAAHLEIQLPAVVDLDVVSSNGGIFAADINGAVKVRTSNGQIVIDQPVGAVVAHTSNGAINVNHVAGDVDAETSNGAIRISQISGKMRGQTSNGQINYSLEQMPHEPITLHTSNGAIFAELPKQAAVEFAMNTSNGHIELIDGDDVRIDSKTKTRFTGSTGTAGPSLDAHTSNGMIRLSFVK